MILLASNATALPVLYYLQQHNLLSGIICPKRQTEDILQFRDLANAADVPFSMVEREELFPVISAMITKTHAGMVLVYTFPYRIPSSLFSCVSYGFYNIHYSLLPAYKGPAPLFWQLKKGDKESGITIHQMDDQFDQGPVVRQLAVPILQGENEGLLGLRLSHLSVALLKELIETDFRPAGEEHKEQHPSYFSRPDAQDIAISWQHQTAAEIENLVNACNPYTKGAVTWFRQQPIRILEVNPADAADIPETTPGTIIHADPQHGIFVLCADRNILRINILQLSEGIFTGFKLSAIGVKAGDRFEDMPALHSRKQTHQIINKH
ncbi:methionyl-tRNA formyltransferase/UDP-4-amino-4-deoxy-L-arabinose formyltransferase / UDP-glucuronic acid dehydrogenase (UDP-4-keto-hexauronic acid decarboxylating) [Pedobacter hartonius]|uniref:Methionyl-tRNA formyltransferase/UDP-4-amino-4-deoxy-L-arabinose formyltransferase / UDP-glucuronic acid dehydrogenase (UDP-4-keto-hexauronic acid decarboxylating) n=2 Tax=Pedobacter hartonius TaxID=425514 RepID=A0A1H3XDL7_9SPHI|nr:methionyl-tRNA formyltransferase/UDP-4-amino-4-deoxy-L-arabinose formyltransferase / UDP-glucuronic acid dehydrogenase (UDP-4-keto-hexauronic acid decarboxylating) [Pedobacter hartonius]